MNLQAVYAKDRFMKLESYIIEVIEKRKKNIWLTPLKVFLCFCSQLFKAGVYCKNFLYDKGVFTSHKIGVPVISIGNIVAGGTGKTSFISFLASQIEEKKIAILSRGYRSKIAHTNAVMEVSNGIGPLYPVDICGDEPFLLSTLISHAVILVGRDRVKAAKMAAELKSKIVLLDDGMQYRRLARELEVVLIHADDPFGKNAFLPRGYLRDHPSRLKSADLIVVHGVKSKEQFSTLTPQIRQYTSSPMMGTRVKVNKVVCMTSNELVDLKGKKIGVFCSIGKPMSFVETLKNMDAKIVKHLFFPDHARFRKKEIFGFAKTCKELGAQWILCTEKDGVKISNFDQSPLPIAIVKTSLDIIEGEIAFSAFLKQIQQLGRA